MEDCTHCGSECNMPYKCNMCGDKFCSDHRLPENHGCPMLDRDGYTGKVTVEVQDDSRKLSTPDFQIPDKLEGNITYAIGATMISVYVLQIITLLIFGEGLHNNLFVLKPNNVTYLWTWITSIFAHSPAQPFHIIGNGIILIFFGRLLEKLIGSKKYLILFLGAGIISGLSQVIYNYAIGLPEVGVLGASGALLAVLGVLTVYKPRMTVYLYFIIPIPLFVITAGMATLSGVALLFGGQFLGIAHGAHLIGLVIGLAYGYKTKDKYNPRRKIRFNR